LCDQDAPVAFLFADPDHRKTQVHGVYDVHDVHDDDAALAELELDF